MSENVRAIKLQNVVSFGDWHEVYICPGCGDYIRVPHNDTFFISGSYCVKCSHFINKDRWFFSSFYLVRYVKVKEFDFNLFKPKTWFSSTMLELHGDWVKNLEKYINKVPHNMVLIDGGDK